MCKVRYLLNDEEKAIVDTHTGKLSRPSCYDTLAPYHCYLYGLKGHKKDAQHLLRDIFNGEQVISNMIRDSQQLNQEGYISTREDNDE
jgi:hypothetical protein